jgi:hypothetical protein
LISGSRIRIRDKYLGSATLRVRLSNVFFRKYERTRDVIGGFVTNENELKAVAKDLSIRFATQFSTVQ